MGWFSSKTKHYVDTQVTRAISNENLSDPKKVAIIEGILASDQSPSTSLLNASLHGPARSFEAMYRYARKGPENNGYIFGLPNLTIRSSAESNSTVKDIIEQKEGKDVTIDYLYFSGLNIIHMAYEHLTKELGFNKNSNEIENWRRSPNINNQSDIWLGYPPKPDTRITTYYYVDKIIAHHITSEENPINPTSVGFWDANPLENINQPLDEEGYSEEYLLNNQGIVGGMINTNNTSNQTNDFFETTVTDTDIAGNENAVEGFTIKYYYDEQIATYDPPVSEHTNDQKKNDEFIPDITNIEVTRKYGEIYVSLEEYDRTKEYFQACYFYDEPSTEDDSELGNQRVWKYFFYEPGEGTYPVLDRMVESGYSNQVPEEEQYFPIASLISTTMTGSKSYYRTDHTVEPEDKESEDYKRFKSTQKLLDYIQIDLEEVGEKLRDQEEDSEEGKQDIEDIAQAIIMMGVPLDTTNELELEYLYEYFDDIYNRMPEEETTEGIIQTDRSFSLEIGDADYSTVISFDNITKEIKEGSIGPANTFDSLAYEEVSAEEGGMFADIINTVKKESIKNKVLRRQILEADDEYPGLYEEIKIYNPMFKTTVKKIGKKVLTVEGGVNDERLLIPINLHISKKLSYFDREMLYLRSLHFVFNSHVKQKVKWYQKGVFKALLTIVAIAITWYMGGWGAAFAAAATTTAMTMVVLKFAVTMVVQMLLADLVFRFAVEQLGIEIAIIIAVAAMIIGGGKAIKNMAVDGLKGITQSAARYLQVASGLYNAVGTEYQKKIGILQEEYVAWMEEAKDSMDELEELRAELINPVDIDPLLFMRRTQPMIVFGESPDSFYNRTIENSNPGIKSIESLESFYDVATMLPKTSV